jgi:hypothetical protein
VLFSFTPGRQHTLDWKNQHHMAGTRLIGVFRPKPSIGHKNTVFSPFLKRAFYAIFLTLIPHFLSVKTFAQVFIIKTPIS